jgi:ribosomal protein S18 acetylase RimI-like enzyme
MVPQSQRAPVTAAFVACTEQHLPALMAFFARAYHPPYVLATNEALLRWQFGQPAGAGDRLHMNLALVDEQVAACLGYIPVQVTVGPRIVPGAWTANWMVAPEYRGLGLGPLLMRALTQQFDITLDAGVSNDAAALLPQMGWTDLGYLPRYVRILDPARASALIERGTLETHPVHIRPLPSESRRLQVTHVYHFEDEVTALWDRLFDGTSAGTRRTAAFLNWRYVSHPVFQYRIFDARSTTGLKGIAVYRVEQVRNVPVRVGRIVELMAGPVAALALLDAIVEDARTERAVALDFFCPHSRLVDPLTSAGLEREAPAATSRLPMLFQPVDHTRRGIRFMAYLRNLGAVDHFDWYVTKGDGDQDRPN